MSLREQIDRMKRKKASDDYEYSGSEEDPSLEQPTIKKHGAGGATGGGALSPTTSGVSIGEDEDDEEEDEFTGQETLMTGRGGPTGEFSDQDTLVIREGQSGVSVWEGACCVYVGQSGVSVWEGLVVCMWGSQG